MWGNWLNTDCRWYGKTKCPDAGVTAEKCWGVKEVYAGGCPDNMLVMRNAMASVIAVGAVGAYLGATPLGAFLAIGAAVAASVLAMHTLRRAQCKIGYSSGAKLPPNVTACKSWAHLNDADCRYYAGGWISGGKRHSQTYNISNNNPSSLLWGQKRKVPWGGQDGESGCNWGSGRAQCERGWSNGYKLPKWASNCYHYAMDADDMCRKTYGPDWEGATATGNYGCPRNAFQSGPFGGGCLWGCSRAGCKKDSNPIGSKKTAWWGTNSKVNGHQLLGVSKCGSRARGFSGQSLCQWAYGSNYDLDKWESCAWLGMGERAICKRSRGDPSATPKEPQPNTPEGKRIIRAQQKAR